MPTAYSVQANTSQEGFLAGMCATISISALATAMLLCTAALVSNDLAAYPSICSTDFYSYNNYDTSYYYSLSRNLSSNATFLVVGGGWIPFVLWAVTMGTSVGHLISFLKRPPSFNASDTLEPPAEGLVRELRRVSSPFWLIYIMALCLMVSHHYEMAVKPLSHILYT
jgi:hypothetical protein